MRFFRINIPIRIEFVPQDCWIGLYWKTVTTLGTGVPVFEAPTKRTYYLCIIPCFPISWTVSVEGSLRKRIEYIARIKQSELEKGGQ